MTIEVAVAQVPGLQRPDLERWISNEWVKPDEHDGEYEFYEIDVARARLIRDLRDEISDAIDHTVPQEVLQKLVAHLAQQRV